jgi:hypothetical protein
MRESPVVTQAFAATGSNLNDARLSGAETQRMKRLAAAAGAAIGVVSALQAPAQHHSGIDPAVAGAYAPRLNDIMTLQQIRHSKLWFAAAANNWELAEHELDALKDAFEDMAKLYPTIREVSAASVIGALVNGELSELGKVIAAQDRFQFTVAYGKLTAACNACHEATKHAFVIIQQPISPPFNNQSFTPTPQDPSAPPHRH